MKLFGGPGLPGQARVQENQGKDLLPLFLGIFRILDQNTK